MSRKKLSLIVVGAMLLSFSVTGWLAAQTQTPNPQAPNPQAPNPAGPGVHTQDLPVPMPKPPQAPPPPPAPTPPPAGPKFYDKPINGEGDVIVFVIDVSGSMDWDSKSYTGLNGRPANGNRIDRAKVEVIRSIKALSDNFKFNLVSYECAFNFCWRNGVKQATDANKAQAVGWVNGLRADGGTGTGPAVAKGLQLDKEVKIVVLLTDGSPNCLGGGWTSGSPNDHKRIIREANTQRATINVFGIGVDGGEFRQFLINVANENKGRYTEVP